MMRLTLRTLMAYLDDILSPADTKIIGQKIQESPMAQLLVSRIREVMRRRRLKAPEVFGPEMGIDPNIVSQYLDNTLPPERYADVERVLLASDEMLAEAAACHQILTLLLAEPADVSQASRDRLYALGPVDPSAQLEVPENRSPVTSRTPHSIAIRNGSAPVNEEAARIKQNEDERITSVPDYLKPTPWSQRMFPSAIVALLIVLCAALLLPGFINGLQQANVEIQRKVERERNQAPSIPAEETDSVNHAMDVASTPTETAVPPRPASTETLVAKLPEGIDPVPPKDDSDDLLPKPSSNSKVVDQPPASALFPSRPSKEVAMATPNPVPKPGPPPTPPVVAVDAAADPRIVYGSSDGVLIRYDDTQRHWFRTPHRTPMKPGEIIANLEPFDGILDFEKAGIRATLVGETVVKLLVPSEAGLAGMGIGRGRILIQTIRSDDQRPGVIGIAIGEDIWKLELLSSDAVVGLEVAVRESTQFQKLNDFHWYQAMIYVFSGSVKWTNRAGIAQEIGDHMALNIIPERAVTVRSNPISFPAASDWSEASKRRAMPLRKYQSAFEKTFDDQPVDQSMLTLMKTTRHTKIAELATRCLSATDNYTGLVQALAECTHEEARFAARDGLRQWLPMNADHGEKLKTELEMYYPPNEAEAIYRMLWGFSREDVKDSKGTAWLLTNSMRNPRLEIRELADYWVERLTGKKTEYRASGVASFRESQVRRLEEQIERDNGLIKSQ